MFTYLFFIINCCICCGIIVNVFACYCLFICLFLTDVEFVVGYLHIYILFVLASLCDIYNVRYCLL